MSVYKRNSRHLLGITQYIHTLLMIEAVRQLQKILVDQHTTTAAGGGRAHDMDITKSYIEYKYAICQPSPPIIDPFDRVNVQLFWGMVMLIQAMSKLVPNRVSDEYMLDCLMSSQTESGARDNPLYQYLLSLTTLETAQ